MDALLTQGIKKVTRLGLEGCLRKKGHCSVYDLLKQLNITPRSNTPLSSCSRMNIVLASDNTLNLRSSKVTKLLLDQVPGAHS